MSRTKKYVTAGATFSVALGIGFVMQYGDAVASRWGADRPVAGPENHAEELKIVPVTASVALPTVLDTPRGAAQADITLASMIPTPSEIDIPTFQLPDAIPAAAEAPAPDLVPLDDLTPDLPDLVLVDLTDVDSPDADTTEAAPVQQAASCDITLTALPAEMAMVELVLSSPCRPGEVVSIHHKEMMFTGLTDAAGTYSVTVPALDPEPFFIAAFADGEGAVAITGVPELALYDRAVLMWQGAQDTQLHALEFGAAYGSDGHVWSGAETDSARAATGDGGFLTRLGTEVGPNPAMAEVYTFPSGTTTRDGAVRLSVEAEVTATNCGREVTAQTLQVGGAVSGKAIDLSMIMPGCDAAGEFLVLKNMFEDLTLAAK